MPKNFRNLLILAIIITASCFGALEEDIAKKFANMSSARKILPSSLDMITLKTELNQQTSTTGRTDSSSPNSFNKSSNKMWSMTENKLSNYSLRSSTKSNILSTTKMPKITSSLITKMPTFISSMASTTITSVTLISTMSQDIKKSKAIETLSKNEHKKNSKNSSESILPTVNTIWECPNITKIGLECSCDLPHTLRCIGDRTALQAISLHLQKSSPGTISLLDVTVTGISTLPAKFLENVTLHGLVISTGELRRVHENAFTTLARPLQALGLPNNLLDTVPTAALAYLIGLDRLDLSHNKLKTLEANSFEGLTNLTYLDLCDNLLSQLSPQAFSALPALRSLRLRGNHLSVSALSALRGLKNLEELDLSNNLLIGSMSPDLLPEMPGLRFLTVSENELVNVQQGALVGLRNLSYLSLSHNQIDVLEDHSFKYLSTLTRLDLANNRIVAVSSSSLAHLEKLTTLDLTHNFLRSLTADLVIPLKSLQDLRLDDNDITMVANDVPTSKLRLKRLSLADNPLNCDCTLLEFANWLSNSSLNDEDKLSAVCATPPALENGILTQVSPGNLLCGEPTPPIVTRVPLAGAQLTLKEFHYDEMTGINLLWHVEPCTDHYTCDTLIIYETRDDNEVEIESTPLHCDSRLMRDPCSLPVTIPISAHLKNRHKYRYCVVLLVPTGEDDVSLGLGCSDIIPLKETKNKEQQVENVSSVQDLKNTQITAVRANVSDQGFLYVDISLANLKQNALGCELSIVVYDSESAIHRLNMNCNFTVVTFSVLLPGLYKVCVSLDNDMNDDGALNFPDDRKRSRCVEVQAFKQNSQLIIVATALASCALLVTIFLIVRSLTKKIRYPPIQAQCFSPTQEFEITHKAHYIKLLATTKV